MITMTERRLRAIGTGQALGFAVVVLVATLSPRTGLVLEDGLDKLWHMAGFAALVFPVAVTRPGWPWRAVLLATALGGCIELIQPHVGRQGEWGDALANLAGAVLGGHAGWMLHPRLRRALVIPAGRPGARPDRVQ